MHFRKADQIFADHELWKSVPERDRRELYDDIVHQLEKKEKVSFMLIILSDVTWLKRYRLFLPMAPAVDQFSKFIYCLV